MVLEIRAALEREIRVIPVLVDGAEMPEGDDLPEGLQGLAGRNAVRLDHETFRSDVATLLDAVKRILPTLAQKAAESTVTTGARAAEQTIDRGRADQKPKAAFVQGSLLAEKRDVAGARSAYLQAIDSGHAEWAPKAAYYLGLLLNQKKDVPGAVDSGDTAWTISGRGSGDLKPADSRTAV